MTRTQHPLPAELPAESVLAIVDSREQHPLNLRPLRSEVGTLATGDYSIRGAEHLVALERKSLPDLISCVGVERERFDREIQRLLAYPCRALIIESTWPQLEMGGWRSRVTPAAALGSVLGWIAMGIPCLLVGDHERAGQYAAKLLYTFARRRWRENRGLFNCWQADSAAAEVEAVA